MKSTEPTKSTQRSFSIVDDPLFYGVVIFFALLATGLSAVLGQAFVLPILQMIALWILCFVAWRRGTVGNVLGVLALWLIVQFATLFAISIFVGGATEAIRDGFGYQERLLTWIYGAGALPGSLIDQPLERAVQLFAVTIGSTISGGILGVAFLVRTVNLYAFGASVAWINSGSIWGLLAALEPWWLLRIVAYAGLVATCSLPGYTNKWNPGDWPVFARRVLFASLILLVVALLLEWLMPAPWSAWLSDLIY